MKDNIDDELEKLRIENELKKMKLMLEHGAVISESPDTKTIHPLIENEFLNSIEAYENAYHNAKSILLYDFIERPDFIPVNDIPDLQISTELDKIMNILNENGIRLDTLCDVEEREIYRFVTEELFVHEMDNMRIPGMMTCFIYEEFHPNHEYDLRRYSFEGIEAFLNKEDEYHEMHFTTEAVESPWFRTFRDAFTSFSIQHFEITDIAIREINASISFNIDFTGIIEGSAQKQNYSGPGSLEFLYQYGYWYIQMINFPAATDSF
jgi:hypothetical protein